MHPIERLRHVARASGAPAGELGWAAARALISVTADDPVALVTGCRRLVDRHPTAGPIWWLAARVLVSPDPVAEAYAAAEELDGDATARHLAVDIPQDATVTVVGDVEQAAEALRRRGDLEVLVVGAAPMAWEDDWTEVSPAGVGAAVATSNLVLLEASALGPTGFVAPAGSRAAAAVARHASVPVWVVAGAGRVLPGRLWDALAGRIDECGDPWDLAEEIVPLDLADRVAGPAGVGPATEAPKRADCPIAPELLRRV
jgi:NAD(P)-dependent dehydrogenase (short-subunit alcohol dehydrogenase family)